MAIFSASASDNGVELVELPQKPDEPGLLAPLNENSGRENASAGVETASRSLQSGAVPDSVVELSVKGTIPEKYSLE